MVHACLQPGCSLVAEMLPRVPGPITLFAGGTPPTSPQNRPGEGVLSICLSAAAWGSQLAVTWPHGAYLAPQHCGTLLVYANTINLLA